VNCARRPACDNLVASLERNDDFALRNTGSMI
jgi:hypothetical protein